LHKSVRSSDADAALYWCTRMIDGGVDPAYLARRLTRMAIEDIGLADPRALQFALEAWDTYDRLGSPEGELALAEVAIYLAIAAKSNAAYAAFGEVRSVIGETGTLDVPMHLRNAPTKLMKGLGYGKGYHTIPTSKAESHSTSSACPIRWSAASSISLLNTVSKQGFARNCWRYGRREEEF
jgi:putative ATPase